MFLIHLNHVSWGDDDDDDDDDDDWSTIGVPHHATTQEESSTYESHGHEQAGDAESAGRGVVGGLRLTDPGEESC